MIIKLYKAVYNPLCLHQIDIEDLSKSNDIEVALNNFNFENIDVSLSLDNLDYNYVYIPMLKRWYWLSVKNISNNLMYCRLSIDLLATYEKTIINNMYENVDITLDNTLIVSRLTNKGCKYLNNTVLDYIPSVIIDNEPLITSDGVSSIINDISSKLLDVSCYQNEEFIYNCDYLANNSDNDNSDIDNNSD